MVERWEVAVAVAEARGRGKAALRWLDRLQGKKLMTAVPGEPPPGGRPASG